MYLRRRSSASRPLRGRAITVRIAATWLALLACPAPAAALTPIGESTQHFRGDDYGGATTSDPEKWHRGYPYHSVVTSHAMYRNKELTREISSLDSRWGATLTYEVPRRSRSVSATFRWDVREVEAIVRGGSPVTTDAGGPNSTVLDLVATSPGCHDCRVSTAVTNVAKADTVSPYQRVGRRNWLWGPVTVREHVQVSVSKTSGSLPSTIELQTFFTMRSRLGGVGSLLLLVDADLVGYDLRWG